jgi:hypothetical protein
LGPIESIVGSIGSQGGALATSFPIMAFMFLWLIRKGDLRSKDWFLTFGLMFIGFVSIKRAIWFILPIIVVLCVFYIPKRKVSNKILLFAMFAVPLIFYLGVRFNPTLNKEGRVGGVFDMNYAIDYAKDYMFGSAEDIQPGTGRGGATYSLLHKLLHDELNTKDWFGHGLRFMYATDYEEFNELNLGISTKGAATGVFQNYVSGGYLGIFATVLLAFSILIKNKNYRFRLVLICFFFWEYFFYTGIILRESSLFFILIILIIYSQKVLKYTNPASDIPNLWNKSSKIRLGSLESHL